jgi:hypothetical protein
MQLLAPIPPSEWPAEALLARLRGRRAVLGRGDLNQEQADSPEQVFLRELTWVYRHLETKFRRTMQAYFEIVAMRQVNQALRYRLNGEPAPQAFLRMELLDRSLRQTFSVDQDPLELVNHLERSWSAWQFVSGLSRQYLEQGPGGVEQQLSCGILAQGLQDSKGVVRWFVMALIDLRNILAVLKYWRWQAKLAPQLLAGGNVSISKLKRIWRAQDRQQLGSVVGKVAGGTVAGSEPRQVERIMLAGIGRQLHRYGRDPLSVAVVIDYLWRRHVAAQNQQLRLLIGRDQQELLLEAMLP